MNSLRRPSKIPLLINLHLQCFVYVRPQGKSSRIMLRTSLSYAYCQQYDTYNVRRPRFETQCAAVMTYLLLMSEPPQSQSKSFVGDRKPSATIHGHEPADGAKHNISWLYTLTKYSYRYPRTW